MNPIKVFRSETYEGMVSHIRVAVYEDGQSIIFQVDDPERADVGYVIKTDVEIEKPSEELLEMCRIAYKAVARKRL